MNTVSYAAPGKVILSGEHAVVYGKPALLSALDCVCRVTVTKGIPDKPVPEHISTVLSIVESHMKKAQREFVMEPFRMTITTDFPVGRGLGSSAAFSAAAVGALLHICTGSEPSKDTINTLAYQAEKKFHGNPSGADNTACTYGGLIYYRKEFEFLKTISALNAKLPKAFEDRLLLIDTGKPAETTAEMVRGVAERYNRDSALIESVLSTVEKLTKRTVVSIITENLELFSRCIHENQEALERLEVVSDTAKSLLADLNPYGTGKVTGAGGFREGSGYILFIAHERAEVERELTRRRIPFIRFVQDFHGVHRIKSV